MDRRSRRGTLAAVVERAVVEVGPPLTAARCLCNNTAPAETPCASAPVSHLSARRYRRAHADAGYSVCHDEADPPPEHSRIKEDNMNPKNTATMSHMWQLAPRLALVLTLPDPAPVEKAPGHQILIGL